jgi:oxalate decarboxylase
MCKEMLFRTIAGTMDFQKRDVGYVQQRLPDYIETTGTEDLIFLEMFKSNHAILSLSEGCARFL